MDPSHEHETCVEVAYIDRTVRVPVVVIGLGSQARQRLTSLPAARLLSYANTSSPFPGHIQFVEFSQLPSPWNF